MKKILLVDDDQLVLQLYSRKLEKAGYQVQTAEDGLLAMKALCGPAPDLVILDLMMPRITGDEVLKFMASKPELAKVLVVVLTNSFMSDQARAVAPFKVSRAITKGDSTPAKLLEIVAQLVGAPAAGPAATGAAASNGQAANHDSSLVNNEARHQFLNTAAATFADLRAASEKFTLDPGGASRSGALAELYRRVHHLAGAGGLARFNNVALMGGALEALLFELGLKPQFINPSTVRTIATSVQLLGELIEDAHAGKRTEALSREVLAVDDDPLANRIARAALSRANLNGQAVESPVAALELLARKQFDLVLLDIEMPDMDGFEVCRKLRLISGYEKTPVIYVTAHSDFESRSRSALAGGNDLIAKPIFPIELAVKAVTYLIGSRRASAAAVA